jgi:hypothetical protein
MKRLAIAAVGAVLLVILVLTAITGLLRAAGVGDEVGDFVFGSEPKATPTSTPSPAPKARPTPSSSDIEFTLNNFLNEPNCEFGRAYPCRTSTGMVVFDADVTNDSGCGINSVVIHLNLLDGGGNVVKQLTENVRPLLPKEHDHIRVFAPAPESLGWEMHDSRITWRWACE